jgi:tetratricopeptide (TPR) repeat protein
MEQQKNLTAENKIVFYCDKVIEYGIYALVFFVPLVYSNIFWFGYDLPRLSLLRIGSSIIISSFLIKIMLKRINLQKSVLTIPIFIYIFAIILSLIFSTNKLYSLLGAFPNGRGFIDLIIYIILYFVITHSFKDKLSVQKLLYTVVFSTFIISIWGIFQYIDTQGQVRITSTFGDPNNLGSFLTMSIPCSLILFILLSKFKRFLLGFIILISFILLFLTYSRSAWLGFLISSIFILSVLNYQRILVLFYKNKNKITTIFFIIILLFLSNNMIAHTKYLSLAKRKESIIIRLIMWEDTLRIIKNYPIFGSGINTFEQLFRKWRSVRYIRAQGNEIIPTTPHNEFLEVGSTIGILGVFSYLFLFLTFFIKGFKTIFHLKDSHYRIFLIGFLYSCLGCFINNQASYGNITNNLYLWLFMGMSINIVDLKSIDTINKTTKSVEKIRKKISIIPIIIIVILNIFLIMVIIRSCLADYYFKKGYNYGKDKLWDMAILHQEMAIKLNPLEDEYYIMLASGYKEKAMTVKNIDKRRHLFDKAVKIIKTSLNISSKDAFSYSILGDIYLYYAESIDKNMAEKALDCFKISLMGDPNNPDLYFKIGWIYCAYKTSFEDAISAFKKSIEIDPHYTEAYLQLANAYYNQKKNKEAVNIVKKAIELDTNNPYPYYFLGALYKKTGDFEQALLEFKKVVKLFPETQLTQKALDNINEINEMKNLKNKF